MGEQLAHEYIYELAVSQDGSARFSAQSSGLYRFDGQNWRSALASLDVDPVAVTAVTLSPDYGSDRAVFAGASGVVLRSMDGGASWEVFRLPAPPPVIAALAIAPDYAHSGTLYAATLEDGVLVSQDHGARWDAWNFGLIGFGVHALSVEEGGKLYAGTDLGVFQSQNTGRSWREVAVFDTPVTALAPASDRLLVGTEGMGLWQLRAGVREQIASEVVTGTVERIISDGFNLLILCNNELLVSRDRGVTWRIIDTELAVTAAAAPEGLAPGAAVLIGGENGEIHTLHLV